MKRSTSTIRRGGAERAALRRRVVQFYRRFNSEDWSGCYSYIDPALANAGKVRLPAYTERLQEFKKAYGSISPWLVRLSLHLDGTSNKHDARPFAYVYVIWQDDAHNFHMFREPWVNDGSRWFTRVVGLVPGKQATS